MTAAPDAWGSARRGVDFYDASMFLWYDVDADPDSVKVKCLQGEAVFRFE